MLHLERRINKLFKKINGGEQGMAMIMALITLALGALLITPTLNYAATGIKSTAIHKRLTSELYAADAGVEYALWCIKNDVSCNSTITVGGIEVNITVGTLTELPYGPSVTGDGEHVDWLLVSSGVVDNGDGTFTFTVTITNQAESGEPPVKLEEIGVGLPDGFTYMNGSSSGLTTDDPQLDDNRLTWDLGSPKPEVPYEESVTQIFLMQGTGTPEGYYSWVNASREDIGTVSTCTGYNIIAQAGSTTIEANAVKNESDVFPASWEIN